MCTIGEMNQIDTFKNVARSFVTKDGLRLIPSCITPVKLKRFHRQYLHVTSMFTYQ